VPFDVSSVRVLVTGGTSGLGRAMAEALVAGGAKVWIGARDRDRLERTLAELAQGPGLCRGGFLDVRDAASAAAAVTAAVSALSGLDVLINNAGIGMRTVHPRFLTDPLPFWEVSPEGFRAVVDTNLTGYFLMARAVVPHFLAQGRGRIVNITMNHETMRRRGFVPYGPSRAGAESLSAIMAEDLRPFGISVNMLLPGGATRTGMIPEEDLERFADRLLPPEIMAEPISFLCSAAAEGLTGERIVAQDFRAWLEKRTKA
jgi:NAD(P)-dependent dehydrogenase (short-subunit alcohol dehydrogenase family)